MLSSHSALGFDWSSSLEATRFPVLLARASSKPQFMCFEIGDLLCYVLNRIYQLNHSSF